MNNPQEINSRSHSDEEDSIDLKRIFRLLLEKWPWFIISIAACLIVGFIYARYTPSVYQIGAKLLVNDDQKGGGVGNKSSALMDLGSVLGSKSSVDNETEILKTRFLMEQVVRQMQLNIIYAKNSNWVRTELEESPIHLNIINSIDTIEYTRLDVQKDASNNLIVKAEDFEKVVKFNEIFKVDGIGTIQLTSNPTVKLTNSKYSITVCSIDERVAEMMKQLSVAATNKQVTIIDLGLVYPLQAKGEEVLRTLITKYTETNLSDKNSIADSTYKFIHERINIIASELGDVENKVESFKQTNRLSDMSEQSKLLVQNTGQFTTELAKAETQVTVMNDLENYLKDEQKNKRVFPTSLLPQDMIFSELIAQYNSLLIERDKQLLSVTEGSPFIQNIDSQISGLRRGILANIQSTKNTYVLTRNKLRSQLNQVENQIGGVPQIEKNYLKLARNQQIKQELYIFLMQKAEETAISKTSNISVAKVIDPPKAAVVPISPKKKVIFTISILLGLILPIVIIVASDLLTTTVRTKDDISNFTNVPIIGEISHNYTNDNLTVANQSRSSISEQFRALRTNLQFYLKDHDQKVILLTSSMSGEGKSFTAINLGNILALSGKKVLLMELDLRKPGLSAKLNIVNSLGFSNFNISSNLKIDDIIKPLSINKNMFIVPSGPLPPNPAEILMNENTGKLINELKDRFDYIILDTPPIGIITDAQLLSQYADMTIYLVRQKVTQKEQLKIAEDLYRNGKMKNIGIVVNDIDNKAYGYGYGYGSYGESEPPSSLSKFFSGFKKS